MTYQPFSLHPTDLSSLGADRAVEFMRNLLWAEAARVGIGYHLVNVPGCINVADGGIDATIKDAFPSADDIIPKGDTGFQIKASKLGPAECVKELHEGGDKANPIKPEIKRILDAGGTYVLVIFSSMTDRMKNNRENSLREHLQTLDYSPESVRVYTADQIAMMAGRFPSVTASLKGVPEAVPYTVWARNRDVFEPRVFVEEEERSNHSNVIREHLRNPGDQCPVFRITGLSGIGKTRFVFENFVAGRLGQPSHIYVSGPLPPIITPLFSSN